MTKIMHLHLVLLKFEDSFTPISERARQATEARSSVFDGHRGRIGNGPGVVIREYSNVFGGNVRTSVTVVLRT